MKRLTYDDWKALGYQVRKGEKATGRDPRTGAPTFTREQVDDREDDHLRHDEDFDGMDHDY